MSARLWRPSRSPLLPTFGAAAPALAVVLAVAAGGCLGGVYREPLERERDSGSSVTTDAAAASPDGGAQPMLSGTWAPCGSLGTGGPWRVAISADGTTAAILFFDGSIALHHLPDGALLRVIQPMLGARHPLDDSSSPPGARSLALSGTGGLVAVTDEYLVAAWYVSTGAQAWQLPGRYADVQLSPDSRQFLVRDSNTEVTELRSAIDAALVHTFDAGTVVGFSVVGQVLSSLGGTLTTVTADERALALGTVVLPSGTTVARLSRNGLYLVATDDTNGTICFRTDGTLLWTLDIPAGNPSFSSDDARVLLGAPDTDDMRIVDSETGVATRLAVKQSLRHDVAVGPAGSPILVVDAAGLSTAPDAASPFVRMDTLPGESAPMISIAMSPDGRWLATAPVNQAAAVDADSPPYLRIWDLAIHQVQREWSNIVTGSVAFSPDSQRLLVTEPLSLVELPIDGSAPTWVAPDAAHGAWTASYAPDGFHVAVNYDDGAGIIMRGQSSAGDPQLARDWFHPGSAFSPDGSRLATSGPAVWRTTDLSAVWTAGNAPFPAPTAASTDNWIAFSPDGRLLATADYDGQTDTVAVQIFAANEGTIVRDLCTLGGRRPAFSSDSAWIVVGDTVTEIASGRTVVLPLDRAIPTTTSVFAPDGTIAAARASGIVDLFCPR